MVWPILAADPPKERPAAPLVVADVALDVHTGWLPSVAGWCGYPAGRRSCWSN